MLERRRGLGPKQLFAVVQVPQVLPRLVPLGSGDDGQFMLLEDVVSARLPELFGGFDVLSWTTFRITRDSDIDLLEQESDDMLRLIEDRLKTRQRGEAVRLEVAAGGNEELSRMIIDEESIRDNAPEGYSEVYRIPGPLDLTAMMELVKLPDREQLRDPPFSPQMPRGLRRRDDLFATIARRDILLHHPYDSFDPVVDFVTKAANDPKVLAIKQTLYRTSGDSPITRALIQAAENGKHVTALVELKARFDEANNVSWARQLERAGVHVVFGFLDWKTHCKLSLVVRQEGNALKRYVHLGTGNYNPDHGAGLHRFGLVHRRRRYWRRRLGAVQFADRLLARAPMAKAGGRADRFASPHAAIDRRANPACRGRQAVANFRQAQCHCRSSRDRSAVSRQPGGRADRYCRPRHLLLAARACRAFRTIFACAASSIGSWSTAGFMSSARMPTPRCFYPAPIGCREIFIAAWK